MVGSAVSEPSTRLGERAASAFVMAAVAWAHRWRDPAGAWTTVTRFFGLAAYDSPYLRSLGVNGFVDLLHEPTDMLLPDAEPGTRLLTADGTLTDDARELICEQLRLTDEEMLRLLEAPATYGVMAAEQVQRAVFQTLCAEGDAERYRRLRRLLIEHPAGSRRVIADAWNVVDTRLDVYEPLPPDARQAGWWAACPLCHAPMRFAADTVACRAAQHRASGAVFVLRSMPNTAPVLTQMGRPARGVAVARCEPADDVVAVRFPVWRYIVIPGLVEVALADRLTAVTGVEVTLWPELDRYDLDVRVCGHRWCVDVKDWRSAVQLAAALRRNPPTRPTTDDDRTVHSVIAVPDHRRGQIPVIASAVPRGVAVMTVGQLARKVAAAASRGGAR